MAIKLITGLKLTEDIESGDDGARIYSTISSGDRVLDAGEKFAYQIISNNCIRIRSGELLMQGRHVRQALNTYTDLTINNGSQNVKRNDIIVARYTKNASTGIENVELAVLQGTPGATAVDPQITTGDIFSGCLLHEMALYRVCLNGLNISSVEPLFNELRPLEDRVEKTKENITFYVSPTGNNANSGKSSDSPFATLAYAFSKIPKYVAHKVTINLAVGTYTEARPVLSGFMGDGYIEIIGNKDSSLNYFFQNGIKIACNSCTVFLNGISAGISGSGESAFTLDRNLGKTDLRYCQSQSGSLVSGIGFWCVGGKNSRLFSCTATNISAAFYASETGVAYLDSCRSTGCTTAFVSIGGSILSMYNCTATGYTTNIIYSSGGLVVGNSGGMVGS